MSDARPRRHSELAAWRAAHLRALGGSLRRLARHPASTLLTIGVMGIALALPLCLAMLLEDMQGFTGSLRESREISVFLKVDADAGAVAAWAQQLKADADVSGIVLRTPEEGLAALRELDALGGTLDVLDYNPLPYVALVDPAPTASDSDLAARLDAFDEVDFVQHDAQWRRRLDAWLTLGRRAAMVAGMLLGLGVLLVIGNTVRLDIQDRAAEIATVRLLGASDAYVRRPFLYLGAGYGLLAGLLAVAVALAVRHALTGPVSRLVDAYAGDFRLAELSWPVALVALLAALALGWLGARLAVGHHLRLAARAEGTA